MGESQAAFTKLFNRKFWARAMEQKKMKDCEKRWSHEENERIPSFLKARTDGNY